MGTQRAKTRKERQRIKNDQNLFRLVESARVEWQENHLRVLANVETRLNAARAEHKSVWNIKKLMVRQGNEDIRTSLKRSEEMEQIHTLPNMNKRLEVAGEELEGALSAKDKLVRQQQVGGEVWRSIFAQIGEVTASEAGG